MTQWFVKDLSRLTGVSVQTLHHYDRVQLLKPSLRLDNGYRVYSEKDLLKLQQIVALKFFGFKLSQIKHLLVHEQDAVKNFAMQAKFLREKGEALLDASDILSRMTSECTKSQSISWEQVISSIEVYKMTQNIEHEWVKEVLNAEELKEYAAFEQTIKANATPESIAAFEKSWDDLLEEVERNLGNNPVSAKSIELAGRWMQWVNQFYGKKYAHIRTKLFEKGFGEGIGIEEHGITPEILAWIEKAMDAYWRERIFSVLNQFGEVSSDMLKKQLDEILDDMYGNENARKAQVIEVLLQESETTPEAKAWLKQLKY
ncbi:MAG: MerR family transcriptional regulator [Legionellaceae bacterium]|nr:MerR family transcriptional regulator [Legionellaceae bacterium]